MNFDLKLTGKTLTAAAAVPVTSELEGAKKLAVMLSEAKHLHLSL